MEMKLGRLRVPHTISVALSETLLGPRTATVIPLTLVGAYLLGGGALLVAAGLTLSLILALGILVAPPRVEPGPRDPLTGLPLADTAARFLEQVLKRRSRRRQTVVMAIGLDDGQRTAQRVGPRAWDLALAQVGDRITDILRGGDQIVRLDGPAFGIVLRQIRRPGIEDALAIAERLQQSIAMPIRLQDARLHVTASIGICFEDDRPEGGPALFMAAARAALEEAQVHGESSLRLFTGEIRARLRARDELAETVAQALETGQITCWYQPQICARSGRLTGMEALARWQHPVRGTLLPEEFLDPIAARGLGPKLFRVVMADACAALRAWDADGLHVPKVSVNVDGVTLRDPMVAEQIAWELDRFDISPERFALEILEDVVISPDDAALTESLSRIAALGCGVELDGFGVAQASLAAISRFQVSRIKIDRSFVTGAPHDAERQRVASAILELARRLQVGTLAEGVATEPERALFAELGCDQLQGFGIARPMAAQAVPGWLLHHQAGCWLPLPERISARAAAFSAGETA